MVGKKDPESMLDESGLGAAPEMGGFALDKGWNYPWCQNLFVHRSLIRQHRSDHLLNNLYQLLFSLLVP